MSNDINPLHVHRKAAKDHAAHVASYRNVQQDIIAA